jgi:hypothetical protein
MDKHSTPDPLCPTCGGAMPFAPATGASHVFRHRTCPDCEAIAWRAEESPTGGGGHGIACTLCDDPKARMHVVERVAGVVVRVCRKCRGVHILPERAGR